MSSNMGILYATACIFSEALIRKQGVNFLAVVYTGGSFECQTTKICDKEMGRLCLGNVEQGGGTPSGTAIASMQVLMDRMRERQKVIIHFTDGYPDDQNSVKSAVAAARKAGYAVWAISLTQYAQMLQNQYGDGNWETIGNIRELPDKVGELVKRLVGSR
jgi:nicotinamidase-related amidase